MVSANGVANGHGKHTVKLFMDTPWVHMCYTHTHTNSKLVHKIPGDTPGPNFWTPWSHTQIANLCS